MKKIFLVVFLLLCAVPLLALAIAKDDGLVPCGNDPAEPCKMEDIKGIITGVINFFVFKIATPLAILGLTVGGIVMLISAGRPEMLGLGKNILKATIIGIFLVFGSYAIISTILTGIGWRGEIPEPTP